MSRKERPRPTSAGVRAGRDNPAASRIRFEVGLLGPTGLHRIQRRGRGRPLQRKNGLRDRLVSLLELPGDAVLDVARITLVGDMELVIENHRGLREYTPNRVGLTTPDGLLQVEGDELKIAAISPEQVIILGKIRSMRYVPPGGEAF